MPIPIKPQCYKNNPEKILDEHFIQELDIYMSHLLRKRTRKSSLYEDSLIKMKIGFTGPRLWLWIL